MEESCVQDIEVIRAALKRRKVLLQERDVPAQHELFERQGDKMGNIILDRMTHVARELMEADRVHKIPTSYLWISPENRLKGEICVSQASHVDKIKALTHQGVLEIGTVIEIKYEKKFLKMLKKAIEETSEFERFECERRLKYALKVQRDIYLKKLNEIENTLREEFEKEKLDLQALYDEKYGQILNDVINNTNEKFRNKLAVLKANCNCDKSDEVCLSSSSVSSPESVSTPSEFEESKENMPEGPVVDIAKKIWNDFEHHLRTQRNILQCTNTTDLIHFICAEKLESQKKVEDVKKECCEKIELLKSYLFDICCKVRCMECQCPPKKLQILPKPACITAEYCRCKDNKICLSEGPENPEVICSCCGKKVDARICGEKYPKEGKGRNICTCAAGDSSKKNSNQFESVTDRKIYCSCQKKENEEQVVEEKKLCCVCRAKQICEIVGKIKWPMPPKPPCICAERKDDKTIPCHCQHTVPDNVGATSCDKVHLANAAVVLPEYIGRQIFCECHSSSSEDDCPCSDSQTKGELLNDKNIVDVCWTEVTDKECVQLLCDSNEKVFNESSSSSASTICKSLGKTISSDESSSSHSQYSCGRFKNKLMNKFNAEEIVNCIFQLSTPENLKSPEYIKRRLGEEVQKKIEEIFSHKKSKQKQSISESCSQGLSSSPLSQECEQLVDKLLALRKKSEIPETSKEYMHPVPGGLSTNPVDNALDKTTHETWKSYVPLPKYLVPMASLFEGGWTYKQTTNEDWKILLSLIEENKNKDKDCFAHQCK